MLRASLRPRRSENTQRHVDTVCDDSGADLDAVRLVGGPDGTTRLATAAGDVFVSDGRHVAPGHVCGLDVNQDMLALARRTGADIEWRQADASRTGLPDASFDVAFCHQGLQFFPDRLAALQEIRRVLAPAGRAVLATWCAADGGDTGYDPIAQALRRHRPDDPDPLEFIAAIFGLSDGTEVAWLAEAAGFDDVSVDRATITVRFPSAEVWVEAFLGAAPVPSVASLDPPHPGRHRRRRRHRPAATRRRDRSYLPPPHQHRLVSSPTDELLTPTASGRRRHGGRRPHRRRVGRLRAGTR